MHDYLKLARETRDAAGKALRGEYGDPHIVVASASEKIIELCDAIEAQAAEIASLKQQLNETCVEHIVDRDDARLKVMKQAAEIEKLRAANDRLQVMLVERARAGEFT